jgi:PPOX class probable F420-dependent enzyme
MAELSEKARELLAGKGMGMLGLTTDSGAVQVTPIWVEGDGDLALFNTASGRPKHRFMARDPRVTLTLLDPNDPYSYVELRGTVELSDGQHAEDQIDRLAKKYIDQDRYPWRQPGEVRVMARMTVAREMGMGS